LGNDRGQPSRTAAEAGRTRRHRRPAGLNSGMVSVVGPTGTRQVDAPVSRLARRAPASESGVARRCCSQCSKSGVAMAGSDLIQHMGGDCRFCHESRRSRDPDPGAPQVGACQPQPQVPCCEPERLELSLPNAAAGNQRARTARGQVSLRFVPSHPCPCSAQPAAGALVARVPGHGATATAKLSEHEHRATRASRASMTAQMSGRYDETGSE
jgi:hypothetical protein